MAEYYVDAVDGSNLNPGTSPASAKQTIAAGDALLTANGDHLWIKGNADYNETITITASGAAYAPRSWEGYTTTPGDGGLATINGQSTRANAITMAAARNDRVWRNIRMVNTTNTCFNGSSSARNVFWNCHSQNNAAGTGMTATGTLHKLFFCSANSPGGSGFIFPASIYYGCTVTTPGSIGISISSGPCWVLFCQFVGITITNTAMLQLPGSTGSSFVVNCLFDGRGAGSRRGIAWSSATTNGNIMIVNNIFHRLDQGIRQQNTAASDFGSYSFIRNNMFSTVTTWFANGWADSRPPSLSSLQFGDTATFVDAANSDYTPLANSPQLKKGIDVELDYTIGGMDLGPIQRIPEVGGASGGLLSPIGTTGGTV